MGGSSQNVEMMDGDEDDDTMLQSELDGEENSERLRAKRSVRSMQIQGGQS